MKPINLLTLLVIFRLQSCSPSCEIVDLQVVRDPDVCFKACRKISGEELCKHLGVKNCSRTDEKTVCEWKCTPAAKRFVELRTCCPGYKNSSITGHCEDIDECETARLSGKLCQGTCINIQGSYACQCPNGFVLDSDGHSCIDQNECETLGKNGSLCTLGTCVNTDGSYQCSCPPGRTLKTDGHTCADVNECEKGLDQCAGGCINTDGSFRCTCELGYVLGTDGKMCEDVDECADGALNGKPACAAECVNDIGSFHCQCPVGYQLDPNGVNCTPIIINFTTTTTTTTTTTEEITTEAPPSVIMTTELVASTTTEIAVEYLPSTTEVSIVDEEEMPIVEASHVLLCPTGFQISADRSVCEDINECSEDICSHFCKNTNGSYECTCPEFLVISNVDNTTCTQPVSSIQNQILAGVFVGIGGVFILIIIGRLLYQYCTNKRRRSKNRTDFADKAAGTQTETFIVCNKKGKVSSAGPPDEKSSYGYHLAIPSIDED